MIKTYKAGESVRLANPSPDENVEYIVIEDRDDRVLVEAQVNLPIKPTYVFAKTDLKS